MTPSSLSASALLPLLVCGVFAAPGARADVAEPLGVVNLSASATEEVVKDWLSISFTTSRNAPTAAAVQSQLKQALEAALAEAKKAARPGEVEVRTGAFSVSPHFLDKPGGKGAPDGWRGSAELVIEGRDLQAIGQLTGRITTLTIANVGYAISRELRAKREGQVTAQAIALFQQRAADSARQFGYAGYALREVTVSAVDAGPGRPMAMLMAMKDARVADEPLALEPGKGTLTVNVSGSVQMTR